jgi:hypothetical protein
MDPLGRNRDTSTVSLDVAGGKARVPQRLLEPQRDPSRQHAPVARAVRNTHDDVHDDAPAGVQRAPDRR